MFLLWCSCGLDSREPKVPSFELNVFNRDGLVSPRSEAGGLQRALAARLRPKLRVRRLTSCGRIFFLWVPPNTGGGQFICLPPPFFLAVGVHSKQPENGTNSTERRATHSSFPQLTARSPGPIRVPELLGPGHPWVCFFRNVSRPYRKFGLF